MNCVSSFNVFCIACANHLNSLTNDWYHTITYLSILMNCQYSNDLPVSLSIIAFTVPMGCNAHQHRLHWLKSNMHGESAVDMSSSSCIIVAMGISSLGHWSRAYMIGWCFIARTGYDSPPKHSWNFLMAMIMSFCSCSSCLMACCKFLVPSLILLFVLMLGKVTQWWLNLTVLEVHSAPVATIIEQ